MGRPMKVAAALVLLVALVACGNAGGGEDADGIVTAESLAGVWRRTTLTDWGSEMYRRYSDDGTYQVAFTLEKLDTEPRVEGTYLFEDGVLVIEDTSGVPGWDMCVGDDQVGRYTIDVQESGTIRFVLVEDACASRGTMMASGEMERVE